MSPRPKTTTDEAIYLIRFLDSWIFALLALVLLCAIVPFLRQSLRSGQPDALGV